MGKRKSSLCRPRKRSRSKRKFHLQRPPQRLPVPSNSNSRSIIKACVQTAPLCATSTVGKRRKGPEQGQSKASQITRHVSNIVRKRWTEMQRKRFKAFLTVASRTLTLL